MKIQASNVPSSNIISERDFARFDNLLKTKPRSTTISLEATIMWASNKSAKWLDSLDEWERERKLKEARNFTKVIKEKMMDRRKQILEN